MCHEMLELTGCNGSTAILVQRPECQPHHLLVIIVIHLVRHHVTELRKFYLPRPICVILEYLGVIIQQSSPLMCLPH